MFQKCLLRPGLFQSNPVSSPHLAGPSGCSGLAAAQPVCLCCYAVPPAVPSWIAPWSHRAVCAVRSRTDGNLPSSSPSDERKQTAEQEDESIHLHLHHLLIGRRSTPHLFADLLQSSVQQPLLLLQLALASPQRFPLQVSLLQPPGELILLLGQTGDSSLGLLQLRLEGAVLVLQSFHHLLGLRAPRNTGVKPRL